MIAKPCFDRARPLFLAVGRGLSPKGWFDQRQYDSGKLRIDAAPKWNRTSDQILFPSLSNEAEPTRQLFLIRVADGGRPALLSPVIPSFGDHRWEPHRSRQHGGGAFL